MTQSPGASNEHHGLPRSFTGSSDICNLTRVNEYEHEEFHTMAGHAPPDFFIRTLMLSSIRWRDENDKGIPPAMIADVINAVMKDDWRDNYSKKAFLSPEKCPQSFHRFAIASIHIHEHLLREQQLTCQSAKRIFKAKKSAEDAVLFRQSAAAFFHVNDADPLKTISRFLTSESRIHGIKWSKPLHNDIRSALVEIVRHPTEYIGKRRSETIRDVLSQHRENLVSCLSHWQPNISAYLPYIQNKAKERMFQLFLEEHPDKLAG